MVISVKQILAWILIILGLFMVFWDISSSYYFFTAQKEFPQVFTNTQTVSVDTSSSQTLSAQDQVGQIIKEQMKALIPENSITQLLNMSTWIIFASFMLWAGGKIVGIGNDFLKE